MMLDGGDMTMASTDTTHQFTPPIAPSCGSGHLFDDGDVGAVVAIAMPDPEANDDTAAANDAAQATLGRMLTASVGAPVEVLGVGSTCEPGGDGGARVPLTVLAPSRAILDAAAGVLARAAGLVVRGTRHAPVDIDDAVERAAYPDGYHIGYLDVAPVTIQRIPFRRQVTA